MSTSRLSRNQISLHEKVLIIEEIQSGKMQKDVAQSRQLPSSTVQHIWSNRTKICEHYVAINPNCKKARPCSFPEIDKALLQWFDGQRSQNNPVNGPFLLRKAQSFAVELKEKEFRGDHRWLNNWKKRHNIRFGIRSVDDDDDNSIDFNM